MLSALFESNQYARAVVGPCALAKKADHLSALGRRSTRANMVSRLTDELNLRVSKGSDIFVAVPDDDETEPDSDTVDAAGQYIEPGPP
jgi:hypothetical protein